MTLQIASLDGHDWFVFDKHDSMMEYLEWQKECVQKDVGNLIRGAIPADRWDHYITGSCAPSLHQTAVFLINYKGEAPMNAHSAALRMKAEIFFETFDRCQDTDKVLIVNMKGGYCTTEKAKLSNFRDYQINETQKLFLKDNSEFLILENDPSLDEWTVANIKVPYSYIVELRSFDNDSLGNAMQQYIDKHPPVLFVYTTGLDAKQMLWYVDVALKKGFKDFRFVQSAEDSKVFYDAKEKIESVGCVCSIQKG